MTLTLQAAPASQFTNTANASLLKPLINDTRAVNSSQIDLWRKEIDDFYTILRSFSRSTADTIFITLAGMSARASEMRTQLVRNESRPYLSFRTKEIEPFIEEVDRQFKFWSRHLSYQQLEWEGSKY